MQDLQLLIEPRVGGDVWQVSPSSVTLSTERVGMPATLNGEVPVITGAVPDVGATIRFQVDGTLLFYGFIFSVNVNRWGVLTFTAYDQLRYLKGNYTGVFDRGCEPADLIKEIASFYQLNVGELAQTGYGAVRRLIIEDQCCLDAIQEQIDLATVHTKVVWNFFDDCGKLVLKSADQMVSNTLLSNDNFCTEFDVTVDIDTDTYNAVALHRPSSEQRARHEAKVKDESSMQKWGALWLCESVDENMNNKQMEEKAKNLLKLKNRPTKTLNISALGVVGLRAGMYIMINFPELPAISKRQRVIIDSITHTFAQGQHTMDLTTKTFWEDA